MINEILEHLEKFASVTVNVTHSDFVAAFGEAVGEHLYKRFNGANFDIIRLYMSLDSTNQEALANMIDEVAARS